MGTQNFDVFLSYNRQDRDKVERLADKLARVALKPWIDKADITKGRSWQEAIGAGLSNSRAFAFFVGPNGPGQWAGEELQVALDRAVKDRDFSVVPVLLPGVPEPFDPNTLPPFLRTRSWVDLRKGVEDRAGFQDLINAIKGVATSTTVIPVVTDLKESPYRGLNPFEEADAQYYFGREKDIKRVIEKLRGTRFLAILGASGSGKSSLVRAGVIPALKAGGLPDSHTWTMQVLTPGARPLETLAGNLLQLYPQGAMQETVGKLRTDPSTLHMAVALALTQRPPTESVVWVIDQFEEVFTLCRDAQERAQFFATLLHAAGIDGGRCRVVITMRADFLEECAAYPELATLIADHQFLVSPMTTDALRKAIEEPAYRVGLKFEEALVEQILADVKRDPGALPLLEYALFELWGRRRGEMLALEGYLDSGGVEGAVAKRADTILAQFSPQEQAITRRVMERLTNVGDRTEDTRRRAQMKELSARPEETEAVDKVVRTLTDARLLTTSRDEQTGESLVDVSHEALIRGWPQLRTWIDEDRADLLVLRRVTEAAQEWERLNRDDGALYGGKRLARAAAWRYGHETQLYELEREFLDASTAKHRKEIRNTWVRGLGAATLLAMLVAVAIFGWRQWTQGASQRWASDALALEKTDPEKGVLLAQAALSRAHTEEAEVALRHLLAVSRVRAKLPHDAAVRTAGFNAAGERVVTASGSEARVWEWRTRKTIGKPIAHSGDVTSAAFAPDGDLVITTSANAAQMWRQKGDTWEAEGPPLMHRGTVLDAEFAPGGALVVTASMDGTAILWDVRTGERVHVLDHHGTAVSRAMFDSSGNRVVTVSGSRASVWNALTGAPEGQPIEHDEDVTSAAFSLDGALIGTASGRRIRVWPAAENSTTHARQLLHAHTNSSVVRDLAFGPDAAVIVTASDDHTAAVWQVDGDGERTPLRGHIGPVNRVAFSPDAKFVVTASDDNSARVWVVAPDGVQTIERTGVLGVGSSPDGKLVATTDRDWRLHVWSPTEGRQLFQQRLFEADPLSPVFNPSSELVLAAGTSGTAVLWQARTGEAHGNPLRHGASLETATFAPDGARVVIVSGSTAQVWDVETTQAIGGPMPHDGPVIAAAFAGSNDVVVTVSGSGVQPWNVTTGTRAGGLLRSGEPIERAMFGCHGDVLVTKAGKSVQLWDTVARRAMGPALTHSSPVKEVILSCDGKRLATLTADAVRIWNTSTQERIGKKLVYADATTAAFAPDNQLLATGSESEHVVVWQVETGVRVADFPEYTGVTRLAFGPDKESPFLVIASKDGAFVYRREYFVPMQMLLDWLPQYITPELANPGVARTQVLAANLP